MHYYDRQGNPCHTVIGKNGVERDTIITDARKLNLVPSVSTIKDVGVGFGLMDWMLNLLLDQTQESPFNPYEYTEEGWRNMIWAKYKQVREQPQKRGREIHAHLENYYKTGVVDKQDEQYITPVIEAVEKQFPGVKWTAEKSFSNFDVGFGGCVDLHSDNIVLDFKTKDKTELKKSMQYDDHKMQLAAYQVGLELPIETTRWNLFISVSPETPGKCLFVEATEFDKFWKMFHTLVQYWQIRNSYIPSVGGVE